LLCASPAYLADKPPILKPADLAGHDCIAVADMSPNEIWSFPPLPGSRIPRTVRMKPRLMVNAAVDGEGILRILSYKVDRHIRDSRLVVLLPEEEPSPVPIHLVIPEGRLSVAKVRVFVDFAVARLRVELARMDRS
jgi:DNA-binding transcriptional LysR family regulator